MDVDKSGETAFPSEDCGLLRFRFAVSEHDDKLKIWLEDRVSKQQWRTEDLQLSDYVTADSAIPRAPPSDYAKRFVDCLLAEQALAATSEGDEAKAATPYTRSLSNVSKDGCRALTLGLRFGVASAFFVDLEYVFTLLPVALEKVDILDAQVRDLKDEIAALKATKVTKDLETAARRCISTTIVPVARASVALTLVDPADPATALRWGGPATALRWGGPATALRWGGLPAVSGQKLFVLSDNGKCVEVTRAGTYLVSLCVSHTSWNATTQFELIVNEKVVRSFTDGSLGIKRMSHTDSTRDSTFMTTASIPARGQVTVYYNGDKCVNVGSTMSIVEL